MKHQHIHRINNFYDGREVTLRVERQLAIQRGVNHQRTVRTKQQGVSVGPRTRCNLGGDIARRTRAVIDHHILIEQFRQLARYRPRSGIQRTARWETHQQAQRFVRIWFETGC